MNPKPEDTAIKMQKNDKQQRQRWTDQGEIVASSRPTSSRLMSYGVLHAGKSVNVIARNTIQQATCQMQHVHWSILDSAQASMLPQVVGESSQSVVRP